MSLKLQRIQKYNFCLVNYYATGSDSISFHSDDERFLGPDPAIISFSLGAKRDFLMKHKPFSPKDSVNPPETKPIKLPLTSGNMVLMHGRTQANWLQSVPKCKECEAEKGRINITLRRAMVPENYYQYNLGNGGVYKWNQEKKEMLPWTALSSSSVTACTMNPGLELKPQFHGIQAQTSPLHLPTTIL